MENKVNVYFFGKKYEVPASSHHHEGNGIRRISSSYAAAAAVTVSAARAPLSTASRASRNSKPALPARQQVEEGMYVATLPFFPLVKQVYDIEKIKPTEQIMMQLYPEIYSCIGCNACTKACTQALKRNAVHRLRSARRI